MAEGAAPPEPLTVEIGIEYIGFDRQWVVVGYVSGDNLAMSDPWSIEEMILGLLGAEGYALPGPPVLPPEAFDRWRALRTTLAECSDAIGDAIRRGKLRAEIEGPAEEP